MFDVYLVWCRKIEYSYKYLGINVAPPLVVPASPWHRIGSAPDQVVRRSYPYGRIVGTDHRTPAHTPGRVERHRPSKQQARAANMRSPAWQKLSAASASFDGMRRSGRVEELARRYKPALRGG